MEQEKVDNTTEKLRGGITGKGFLPGEEWTGNANGRPKGSVSVVEAIRRKLEEVNPESKRTYLEDLTEVLFGKAIKDKDVSMIKDIIDRVDGKALQKTDLTSKGEKIELIIREGDGGEDKEGGE